MWGRVGREQYRRCRRPRPAVAVVTDSPGFLLDRCPQTHSSTAPRLTRHVSPSHTTFTQRSGWSLHGKSHCGETLPLWQRQGFRSPSAGRWRPTGPALGALCASAAQGPSFRRALAAPPCPFHAGSPPPRRTGGKLGKCVGRIVRLVLRKILLSSAVRCAEFPLPCCFFCSSQRLRGCCISS